MVGLRPAGDIVAGAEPLDGPALTGRAASPRELGIDLVAGSIAEHVDGAERGANTSVHIGPDGEDRALYRKVHMFDVEVGGRVYRESEIEAPGEEVVLTATADGVEVGLSICYDLRFPELYRILAVRGRAHPHRARRVHPRHRRASTGRCSCAPARSRTSAS